MWNSSLWEQENQEKIKAEYFERLRAGTSDTYVYPIRRIICGGCGKVFYTYVRNKKYCNERCCSLGFWKHKREERLEKRKDMICKTCGNTFTPKRSDAVYCSNACRQKAYSQSVTDDFKSSKWGLSSMCNETVKAEWVCYDYCQVVKMTTWQYL